MGEVGVKGRGKLLDSSLEFQGPFEIPSSGTSDWAGVNCIRVIDKLATSMLVVDVGYRLCWWQLLVTVKFCWSIL